VRVEKGQILIEHCEEEILGLHRFFERWFSGAADLEDLARLSGVLSERFLMVTPEGETLDRRSLVAALHQRHGCYAQPRRAFRIAIRDIRERFRSGGHCLVTYEEWQEVDGHARGRVSSALFRERSDAPHGVEWIHLHETWLGEG
jgi:hypothetical protein